MKPPGKALILLVVLALVPVRVAWSGKATTSCGSQLIGTWKLVGADLVKLGKGGKVTSSKPYDFKKHFKNHEMSFWDHDYGQAYGDYVKKKAQKKFKKVKEFRYKVDGTKLRMDVKKEKPAFFSILELTDTRLVMRDMQHWWLTELFMVTTYERISCKKTEYQSRTWKEKDYYAAGPPEVDFSKLEKKWGKLYYNVTPYTGTAIRHHGSQAVEVMDVKDGLLHGPNIKWYTKPAQQKQVEGHWVEGKKDGTWTQWYESGIQASEEGWKKGKKHGRWTIFYQDGQKKVQGEYGEGKKHGAWATWDKSGNAVSQELWMRGIFIAVFDPSLGIEADDLLSTISPDLAMTAKGLKHDGACASWPWTHVSDGLMGIRCRCIATDGAGNTILGLSKKLKDYGVEDKFRVLEVWKWGPDGSRLWSSPIMGRYGDRIVAVTTDAGGNSTVAGITSSKELLVAGQSLATQHDGRDVFVASYDPDGNLSWAHRIGGSGNEEVVDIVSDSSGHVVVLGRFSSPELAIGQSVLKNPGGWPMFLARFDPQGNVLWARKAWASKIPPGSGIFAGAVAVDGQENVYVTGGFKGKKVRFGKRTLTNSKMDTMDAFLVKYDPSGTVKWARGAGGPGSDKGNDVTVDASGDIIVTGSFGSSMKIGKHELKPVAGNTSSEVFLARFNGSGKPLSAWSAGGKSIDQGISVSTAGGGEVYVNIRTTSSQLVLSGTVIYKGGDPVVVKLDRDFRPLWAMRVLKFPGCFCWP